MPWREQLDGLLAGNEAKPARERLTLMRVFESLRDLGFDGGYDAVRRYAKSWRKARGAAAAQAYIPLSFAPGEAYQFDWSHEVVLINGITVKVKVAQAWRIDLGQGRRPLAVPLAQLLAHRPHDRPIFCFSVAKSLIFSQYTQRKIGQMPLESVLRIEPALLEEPTAAIADVLAELSAAAATLGRALHPRTATSLADVVRIMNTYYSNLIEGHDTRPRDIERALLGEFDQNETRRNLQLEAAAHVRVQAEIDRLAGENVVPPPASQAFLKWLHCEFYRDAPDAMLTISAEGRQFRMEPGEWRSRPEQDVAVGRHLPPSSERVADFMAHFENRFRLDRLGKAGRTMAIASAHHRFNYIHPFPDGNGRVSRLMSHAMASAAGIGAHGLWSISRGLARGLESRADYKRMMDHADAPRQGDLDGRGNLSEAALKDFVLWFLKVCLDQVTFMGDLFDLNNLAGRLRDYAERRTELRPESGRLLEEALLRGDLERGEAARITGLPERTARRTLADIVNLGLLASDTPKGRVSLRFPAHALEDLFPRLYPRS